MRQRFLMETLSLEFDIIPGKKRGINHEVHTTKWKLPHGRVIKKAPAA
jgi:hypothetical protein